MSDMDDMGDGYREWQHLSPVYKSLLSVARWSLLLMFVVLGMIRG